MNEIQNSLKFIKKIEQNFRTYVLKTLDESNATYNYQIAASLSWRIILFSTLTYGVFAYIFPAKWPQDYLGKTIPITMWFLPLSGLSLYLSSRNLYISQFVWQVGVVIAITLALYIFPLPIISILFLFSLSISMITLGWRFSLIYYTLCLSLIFFLMRSLLPDLSWYLLLIGCIWTGLLSCLISSYFYGELRRFTDLYK